MIVITLQTHVLQCIKNYYSQFDPQQFLNPLILELYKSRFRLFFVHSDFTAPQSVERQ
jgi:hypothetical protein